MAIECRDPRHQTPRLNPQSTACMQECSTEFWYEDGRPWRDVAFANPTFYLIIQTLNNALLPDVATEIARLLREVAQLVERGEQEWSVRDSNGNTVGHFMLSCNRGQKTARKKPNTQRPDAAWFAPISRLLAKIMAKRWRPA